MSAGVALVFVSGLLFVYDANYITLETETLRVKLLFSRFVLGWQKDQPF